MLNYISALFIGRISVRLISMKSWLGIHLASAVLVNSMRWRPLVIFLALVTLAGGGIMFFRTKQGDNPKLIYFDMELTSPAFKYNESIPVKFTCDGQNISPPLQFSGIPVEAKSLALLMWDPDVPRTIRLDGNWDHWVVFNMPASTKGIEEGATPDGIVGVNTRGVAEYGGRGGAAHGT